jgi:ferredoxin-NADP reductase
MTLIKPQTFQARIEKKEQLTEKVILFTFKLTDPISMQFIAGQYGAFVIDEKTRRQYSFCSAPGDPTTFEVVIDTAPMGPGSKFFLAKNIGDTAICMAPLGTFVLDKTSPRKKIMVATGTGIAPFRSMILDYLGTGGTDDITLYWGMRHEEDLYWIDEFQELSVKYPNFKIVLTLSQPSPSWEGTTCRVTSHVIQEEQNPISTDFYLCGNRMMIKDIEIQLTQHAVPIEQIHKEMYF